MNRIERIEQMEACLEAAESAVHRLDAALAEYESAHKAVRKLFDYYGSVQWMQDYEADEAGKLPDGLKRGVLSEDTVYDLIQENRALGARMLHLVERGIREKTLL